MPRACWNTTISVATDPGALDELWELHEYLDRVVGVRQQLFDDDLRPLCVSARKVVESKPVDNSWRTWPVRRRSTSTRLTSKRQCEDAITMNRRLNYQATSEKQLAVPKVIRSPANMRLICRRNTRHSRCSPVRSAANRCSRKCGGVARVWSSY